MTTAAMLLILTNSYDGTTDLLINRLSAGKVFRLNCDLLPAYKIEVTNDGFIVEDSTGRLIKSHQITKLYFRKPWVDSINHSPASDGTDKFCNAELRYLIAEIVNILWIQGKIVLVEPYAERRCGKFIQLMIAKNYFDVPDWIFTFHTLAASRTKSQIVKALSGEQVSKGRVLYTTQVDPMRLDSAYPWLIQDYITAIKDLTVVYCRGQMFAYSLERTFIKNSADWREFISEDQLWTRHDLSFAVSNNIARYMHHLNLDFGRLDFLLDANDNIVFCEVNPNGQYAWLDINGKDGLLDCIVSEISPETSLHPIPHSCPITSFSEMQLLSTP